MRSSHCLRALVACVLFLTLPGCCTLARLFCGPDRTPWVSVGFETPAATLATFREAARRDDPVVAFRCLSEDFKRRTGLVGTVEAGVAWERLKDEVSGLHLLGYAEVTGPDPLPGGRFGYELEVSGHRLAVVLARQAYWEVRWATDEVGNDLAEDGRYVDSLAPIAQLDHDPLDGTRVAWKATSPVDANRLDLSRITAATVGHLWKVDDLRPVPEQAGDPASP